MVDGRRHVHGTLVALVAARLNGILGATVPHQIEMVGKTCNGLISAAEYTSLGYALKWLILP